MYRNKNALFILMVGQYRHLYSHAFSGNYRPIANATTSVWRQSDTDTESKNRCLASHECPLAKPLIIQVMMSDIVDQVTYAAKNVNFDRSD